MDIIRAPAGPGTDPSKDAVRWGSQRIWSCRTTPTGMHTAPESRTVANVVAPTGKYVSGDGRGKVSAVPGHSGMGRCHPTRVRSFPYPQCHDHEPTTTVH